MKFFLISLNHTKHFTGPNSITGHTSSILAVENSINYSLRVIKPILDGKASVANIRAEAEEEYAYKVQDDLKNMVWSSGCSNWYHAGTNGKWNAMAYPYSQAYSWYRSLFPQWDDWEYSVSESSEYMTSSQVLINIRAESPKRSLRLRRSGHLLLFSWRLEWHAV